MEDSRGAFKWLWILGGAALVVAIVGLVLAISAKNSAVDTDQIVNEATSQLKGELTGLNGAIKAGKELQAEEQERSAEEQKQIKREVNAAIEGGESSLVKLKRRVKDLESEADDTTKSIAALEEETEKLQSGQENLEAQVKKLKERLNSEG